LEKKKPTTELGAKDRKKGGRRKTWDGQGRSTNKEDPKTGIEKSREIPKQGGLGLTKLKEWRGGCAGQKLKPPHAKGKKTKRAKGG